MSQISSKVNHCDAITAETPLVRATLQEKGIHATPPSSPPFIRNVLLIKVPYSHNSMEDNSLICVDREVEEKPALTTDEVSPRLGKLSASGERVSEYECLSLTNGSK